MIAENYRQHAIRVSGNERDPEETRKLMVIRISICATAYDRYVNWV